MNERHAWLCVRTAVSRSLVLIIFVVELPIQEMLETVIKFHRLKYVRGKNKKAWLTMVLESIGSVGGERKAEAGDLSKQLLAGMGGDGKRSPLSATTCYT